MGLDSIKLPAIILYQFFKNSLVDLHGKNTETPGEKNIRFIGANKKKVALITEIRSGEYLPDNHLKFITGFLKACNLGLDDVAIINASSYPNLHYQQVKELPAKKIILFGVGYGRLDLSFNVPEYQVQKHNEVEYLSVPSIEDLIENAELKKNFWQSLQKLFSL